MKVYIYLFTVIFSHIVCGERTSGKIYQSLEAHQACFRLLNATNQIGCSSKRGGNVGVVHYAESVDDVHWLINHGPHKPYIVVFTPHTFNSNNVEALRNSGKINGMLVINDVLSDVPYSFSPDHTCPNQRSSFYQDQGSYSDCRWNPAGNSMMFEDYDIPILTLTDHNDVDFLVNQCFYKYNNPVNGNGSAPDYPLCSAELKDDMFAAKDTPTCIRRSNLVLNLNPDVYCDPLGDYNVYALSRALNNSEETIANNSVIIAGTRMDGFSMFEWHYNLTESVVSGVLTLLTAAHVWGQVKDNLTADHHPVMFTFFQGEAFDYIGSGRLVYDMSRGEFPKSLEAGEPGPQPLGLNKLRAMLEVTQLGADAPVWMHSDPVWAQKDPAVATMISDLKAALQSQSTSANVTVQPVSGDKPLPPASLQSFLKEAAVPGLVLTGFEHVFTNRYYNSRFDRPEQFNASYPEWMNDTSEMYDYVTPAAAHVAKVGTLLARSLYKLSTGMDPPADMTANDTMVANMFFCFTKQVRCELFYEVLDPRDLPILDEQEGTYSWYVSVSTKQNHVTRLVHRLLTFFLGSPIENITSSDSCNAEKNELYEAVWMAGPLVNGSRVPVCMQTTANMKAAVSPAFEIDDYDWDSAQYSSWTESRWESMRVRLFLVPSQGRQIMAWGRPGDKPFSEPMMILTLMLGIILLVLSLAVAYILQARAHLLFHKHRLI